MARESARVRSSSSSSPSLGGMTAAEEAERFADDILVEILSRVPAKSLCRFKCVSKHWLGLIDDRHHRKKLRQTLTGFFSTTVKAEEESTLHFTTISGNASQSFFPQHVQLLDCCNGLLLYRWFDVSAKGTDEEYGYIVTNTAANEWVALPAPSKAALAGSVAGITRLGFNLAVSPHFHVFEVLEKEEVNNWILGITGVAVYSSETGRWVHKNRWNDNHTRLVNRQSAAVFHNGYLHFHALDTDLTCCLAAVDMEGEARTNFGVPGGLNDGFIQLSQGSLHYANFHRGRHGADVRLVVYVLEDYDSKEWTLKHSVESYQFGPRYVSLHGDLHWIAIHPECNLIFFTAGHAPYDITFMCYDMNRRRFKVISNLEDRKPPYFPYVPLYAELPSLHT